MEDDEDNSATMNINNPSIQIQSLADTNPHHAAADDDDAVAVVTTVLEARQSSISIVGDSVSEVAEEEAKVGDLLIRRGELGDDGVGEAVVEENLGDLLRVGDDSEEKAGDLPVGAGVVRGVELVAAEDGSGGTGDVEVVVEKEVEEVRVLSEVEDNVAVKVDVEANADNIVDDVKEEKLELDERRVEGMELDAANVVIEPGVTSQLEETVQVILELESSRPEGELEGPVSKIEEAIEVGIEIESCQAAGNGEISPPVSRDKEPKAQCVYPDEEKTLETSTMENTQSCSDFEATVVKEDAVEAEDKEPKEEENKVVVSELAVMQSDEAAEVAAVKEKNEEAIEGEAQMAKETEPKEENKMVVSELPVMQSNEAAEVAAVKEKNDEAMEGEAPTAKETEPKEEETKMVVSELPVMQSDDEAAKVVAVKEKNEVSIEGEDQMEVPNPKLDESQLVGETELSDEKDANVGGVVVADREEPTVKEDEKMADEELGTPTAKEDEDMVDGEEHTPMANEDEETEEQETPTGDVDMDIAVGDDRSGDKRKRGKSSKVATRAPTRKLVGDDVCFICFDGGDLVLCDRRGCTKAYHPPCVNRDEAFFQTKGRWNCGWHLCSKCEKNAYYNCYTCTYSLCKGCTKEADVILTIRGNKGLCQTCMNTVMMIENNELKKDEDKVNFNDRSSWEFLFKDYWTDLKEKLSLTSDEVSRAKCPWTGSDSFGDEQGSPVDLYDPKNEDVSGSDKPSGNKSSTPRKRKSKKLTKAALKEEDSASDSDNSENRNASKSKRKKGRKNSKSGVEKHSPSASSALRAQRTSRPVRTQWATQELLEFVMHMKDGATNLLSQFDVQALLLEYIKRNKLRDPRRKSQIICDARLQKLFGKPRVGHFEMLKLLESHFLIREDSQIDDLQGNVVNTDTDKFDADPDTPAKTGKDRKRKARRKGGLQSNMDDYAAIDTHNINLIYLKRNVIDALLEDSEYFHDKVVGSFVRIRIIGSHQKQELYRLVQVVGTSKAAEPYKIVKRTTDIILEIQNLNKKEVISIDIISNQDFTEDELKRLRQSIKCGLINPLTLGDIYEKAMVLQEVKVNDWLEAEVIRLSHLRDRASDTGRRKELRECVEKLQRLKTPEERLRRLEEIPEVHSDPKMDPSYESEEEADDLDDIKPDNHLRPRSSGFSRSPREHMSPTIGGSGSNDTSWSGTRNSSNPRESTRIVPSRGFSNRREDGGGSSGYLGSENNSSSQERNRDRQQLNSRDQPKPDPSHTVPVPEAAAVNLNGNDKVWLYKDPSGKIQGPFSMAQLHKWNNSGYFPVNLRIWKNDETEGESILLTNALTGNFQKDIAPAVQTPQILQSGNDGKGQETTRGTSTLSVETTRLATNGWNSDQAGSTSTSNLPSPTPTSRATGYDNMSPVSMPVQTFSSAPKTPQSGGLDSAKLLIAGFLQQANREQQREMHNDSAISFPNASSSVQSEVRISSESSTQYQTSAVSTEPGLTTQAGQMYNPIMDVQSSFAGQTNQNPMSVQQQAYTQWSNTAVPVVNQANMQAQPNLPFVMGNQSMSWVGAAAPGNTNMAWAPTMRGQPSTNQAWAPTGQGTAPGSMNQNWVAPNANQTWVGPTPGNTSQGWVQPGNIFQGWAAFNQGQQPVHANPNWSAPGNNNPGWSVPGQVPGPGNANPGWIAPNQGQAQGPAPGNSNTSWAPPNSNQNNRPVGNGRGSNSSRPFNRGAPGVCDYHMSGHCKKGASCDRMHT